MKNRSFYMLLAVFIASACVKEDHFGRSAFKQILFFSVPGQTGNAQIIEDSLLIRLSVSAQTDITNLAPDSVLLSSYAKLEPGLSTTRDFSQPVVYTVQAENGLTAEYTIITSRESETPQLENSDFDEWYTPAGKNYKEPGRDASTIWASGNAGVVTISTANVVPAELSGTNLSARMITKDLGSLGQLVSQRMGAGSIFTGRFELDIANPLNSTKFGIAFTARPKSFTISYLYTPGLPYKNNKGAVIDKKDSCDIYLLLENRESNTVKRIATAWFRSDETVTTFQDITLTLTYGALPSNTPQYMFPSNNQFGNASEKVTHIVFVAASSASGALFEGGVNSTLEIDKLKLNY